MKSRNSIALASIVLTSLILLVATPAAEAQYEDSGFDASVYLWYADVGGQSITGRTFDVDASDLIDDMEFGIMALFEARMGKWSLLGDVIYLDLESRESGITVNMENWIVSPGVGYNLAWTENARLDIIGGARYVNMRTELDFTSLVGGLRLSGREEIWDGIVGLRGNVSLGGNWRVPFYFDVGAGDSDLTWQALGGLAYQFNSIDLFAGYRHIEWAMDGGRVLDDLDISGPYAGLRFKF
jgi:hypothetical protein